MKFLLGLVCGISIAIGLSGRAMDLQVEGGQCRFGKERDGMYYNADQPYSLYLTPGCQSVGIADKFGKSRWGYTVAFMSTGSIQVRDAKARVVDGSHEIDTPCNPSSGSWWGCHATFNSAGYLYGYRFGLTYTQPLRSRFSLVGETGLFHFRSVLRSSITPVDYYDKEIFGVQDSGWSATPAPYVGLFVKYWRIYAGARYYWPADHRAHSVTNHAITQITVGMNVWTF